MLLTLGKSIERKSGAPGISRMPQLGDTCPGFDVCHVCHTHNVPYVGYYKTNKKDFLFFLLISDDDITLLLLGRKIIIKEKKDLASSLPPGVCVCVISPGILGGWACCYQFIF